MISKVAKSWASAAGERENELIIDEIPLNDYEVISSNNVLIGIKTLITKELREEGLIRDLIRQVQNLRKDSGLNVEDRIRISIDCNKQLDNAIKNYKLYFMNEVLGVEVSSSIKYYLEKII